LLLPLSSAKEATKKIYSCVCGVTGDFLISSLPALLFLSKEAKRKIHGDWHATQTAILLRTAKYSTAVLSFLLDQKTYRLP
jgi:hypothetical protein